MVQKTLSKIKANTIMFVAIVLAITLFKKFFGNENSLVGVSIIISALVLLKSDLTKKPLRNLILLTTISLILGLFSFWANLNIYLGFVLNFVAMSGVGFLLSKNLTKKVIIPYGLQYLFMLYTPVTGDVFSKRVGALIFGAFFIVVINYIANFKRDKNKEPDKEIDIENKDDPIKDSKNIHLRIRYAVRLGLMTALAAFITAYFNLSEGRWMAYTIFSVTELFPEHTNLKVKQRVEGTIIGAIAVVIMFVIFSDTNSRVLIMILAGYLNSFFDEYKHKMILVTISAIASVALSGGILIMALERIGFVIIGAMFAILGNKIYEKRQLNL